MGRPTKRTPELVGKLLEYLSWGCTVDMACAYVGIGRTQFYEWEKRFPDIRARAQAIAILRDSPQASAEFRLERRFPDLFGKPKPDATVAVDNVIRISIDQAREDERARAELLPEIQARLGNVLQADKDP